MTDISVQGGWGNPPSHPSMPGTPKPRPIGISTVIYQHTLITSILYDDGSVWEHESASWTRLPPPRREGHR